MGDTSRTTNNTPPLPYGDPEGLAPLTVHPEKEPLSITSWFICLVLRHASRLPISIRAVLLDVTRRYTLLLIAFLYLILIVVIARASRWSYGRNPDARRAIDQIPYGKNGVALIGHSYKVDPVALTLSVQWEIVACGTYALPAYPLAGGTYADAGCDVCDRSLDIYFNNAPEPTFSYDPAKFPTVELSRYYPLDKRSGPRYMNVFNTFNVDHGLDPAIRPGLVPYDSYTLIALVFIVEKATNASVPIITFAAGEGTDNFVVSSTQTPTKSNYTYDPGTGPTTVEVGSAIAEIWVRRSMLAKAFTISLALINTALAIGTAYITLLVVIKREKMKGSLLLLPVTVVLTIPALRGLYVGSPPFGIYIDTFGFFLQMIIVATCSVVLLYPATRPSAKGEA